MPFSFFFPFVFVFGLHAYYFAYFTLASSIFYIASHLYRLVVWLLFLHNFHDPIMTYR